MGKKKKGLLKKVNPEKSNKMIYAVLVGVFFLFMIAVAFVLNEDKKRAEDPVLTTQKVLKESDEIIDAKINKDNPNLLNIIIKAKSKEVMKFIKTEGIELSKIKRKIEFEIIISIMKFENEVYSLKLKDGDITNFKSI